MEKRYQVFVSSTFEDLIDERQEVMQALLELDCIPAGMELFPAADDDQWTLIKRVIDDCDYYIVIVGGRYGSVGPGGKSFTQMEYEYAVEQGKPVIVFLHKDPGKLPAEKTEKDPEAAEKLQEFLAIAKKKMVKYWTNPADLGSVTSRSLIKLVKTNPAIGWVKADLLPSKDAAEEILSLRKKIDLLEKELDEVRTSAPSGTEYLSQGEDLVELHYTFGAYKTNSYRPDITYKADFEASWNDIFARISPFLIDESSDRQIKSELDLFVRECNVKTLQDNQDLKDCPLGDFNLSNEDFNTIKVQLLALRLMKKSERNRSVKDKASYWTLTPYGDNVMTQLRAIRRPGYERKGPKPSNKALSADS